jgi:hypothetical protein
MKRQTIAVLVMSFLAHVATAQFVQQGSKLVATGASGESRQGSSVAISADGSTAIVGGFGDNNNVGAAWVFTRKGSVWSQQGSKLVGTGAVGAGWQGLSVAISADGDTAIVGGPFDNSKSGAAWVYTRSNGTWSQQGGKLVGTGAVGASQQGWSVAISGDGNTTIVGGNQDNDLAGGAWVYTRGNGVWSQQGRKLVGSGAVGAAQQGTSVAISADGNTVILGGPFDNNTLGAIWVFRRNGGLWSQQGRKLVGTSAGGPISMQGTSVAISADGKDAIVGADNGNVGTGGAWIFARSNGVWSQQGSALVGTGAVAEGPFPIGQGDSVAISADASTAFVGGPTDGGFVGATWVYKRSNGVWSQQGSKLVGTGADRGSQGKSVAISADGNTLIVGGEGAAWVFKRSEGQ